MIIDDYKQRPWAYSPRPQYVRCPTCHAKIDAKTTVEHMDSHVWYADKFGHEPQVDIWNEIIRRRKRGIVGHPSNTLRKLEPMRPTRPEFALAG